MASQRDISLANEQPYSRELASGVREYFSDYTNALSASRRFKRIKRSVQKYYSESGGDETEIQSGGTNGELTLLTPNEYRSLTQSQLNIITQNPPAFEAGAMNRDIRSVRASKLAQIVLNHYLRFKRLDNLRVRRAEIAAVTSESFVHAPWDPGAGRKALVNAEGTGTQSEGDILFEVVAPWDCAYDWLSPDRTRARQFVVRVPRNRWDLAAQYPKHREAILAADSFSEGLDDFGTASELMGQQTTKDYVGVLYYYCERTPDRPNGRQAVVFDEDLVLDDNDLQYERCAVFRLAPAERIVGAGGHTNNFELMPITEAYAAELSIIISNHATFGNQVIAIHKGTGVKPHFLGNGLNGLEWDSQGGMAPPPQALTLCATPKEVFDMTQLLRSTGERFLAVSAASRGESVEGDSGSKSALLAAAAEQFATSFAQALSRSDEDIGMHIIDTLRRHATVPRLISMAGKGSADAAREFVGSDLNGVHSVSVRARTPMLDTPEGRERMLPNLLKIQGGITTGEQLQEFVETGRYTPTYEGPLADTGLIARENDELIDGNAPMPIVAPSDQHAEHYKEHSKLHKDPEVRRDPDLMKRIDQHLAMHEAYLTPTSPQFQPIPLLLTGQQPMPPQEQLAAGGGPADPTATGAPGSATPPMPAGAPANDNGGGPPVGNMPSMPSMPVDPSSGRPPMQAPAQAQAR